MNETDYTGCGSTIRTLKERGYSLGSNNDLWWLHGGDPIATKDGKSVVVADMITSLLEEGAALKEALINAIERMEASHPTIGSAAWEVIKEARAAIARVRH